MLNIDEELVQRQSVFESLVKDIERDMRYNFDQNIQRLHKGILDKMQQVQRDEAKLLQEQRELEFKKQEFYKKNKSIMDEQYAWHLAQAKIGEQVVAQQNDVLKLNVGGQHIDVSRRLLTKFKGTLLDRTFSGEYELQTQKDGRIFLDRNGGIFAFMVDCLKTDGDFQPCLTDENVKQLFDLELKYWGIGAQRMQKDRDASKFSLQKLALSKFNSANYEVNSQITYRFSSNDDQEFNTKDMQHVKDPRGRIVQKTVINLDSPQGSKANSFIGQLRRLGSASSNRSASNQKYQQKPSIQLFGKHKYPQEQRPLHQNQVSLNLQNHSQPESPYYAKSSHMQRSSNHHRRDDPSHFQNLGNPTYNRPLFEQDTTVDADISKRIIKYGTAKKADESLDDEYSIDVNR